MKLIVISNPTNVSNEHSLLNSMFEMGLEYFHLRKPNFTDKKLKEYIELIPEQFHNRVIIHSHHQLAIEYGLKGVHYTSKNQYQELTVFPKHVHQSASFHSLDELKMVNTNFQYVFLSPVFDSISKAGYKSTFNLQKVRLFLKNRKDCDSKDFSTSLEMTFNGVFIALGGIDEHTIPQAAESGFDGVAVLGALWQAKNPADKFNRLADACSRYNKIRDEFYI